MKQPKLLIVEDDLASRLLLTRVLEKSYDCVQAGDGADAFRLWQDTLKTRFAEPPFSGVNFGLQSPLFLKSKRYLRKTNTGTQNNARHHQLKTLCQVF